MTRMGLHVNAHLGWDGAVDYCREVQPAIMKWLCPSRQVLERCRAVSPNTKHVLRPYWANQDLGAAHDAFVRHSQDAVREFGTLINWYEGYNEFECRDVALLKRFCAAEMDRARKLNAMGVGCALGGFSTGAFDHPQDNGKAYAAVKPMLEFLHATGPHNVWHSHEYAGPYMAYMTRTADGLNQWPRPPDAYNGWSTDATQYWADGLDGWLTLRYRMTRAKLAADGLTNVYMIFTETGIDDTNPRPGGANRKGWRDYDGSEWSRIPGQGNYAHQQYWYGWHLSRDPYVLGWVDFGYGSEDPAWWSFSLDRAPDMFGRVKAEQLKLPTGHVEEEPTMTEGIDVSHWQGRMDWSKAKAKGVTFAWCKATEGDTYLDDEYARNIKGARENGIAVGAYHYYKASVPWMTQLGWLDAWINYDVLDLPIVVDLEDTAGNGAVSEQQVREFVECIADVFGKPIIYTGMWWVNKVGAYKWTWLKEYPLWMADYNAPYLVPDPWDDWTILQYSNKGDGWAYGARADSVDLNRTRLTVDQLRVLKPQLDHAALVAAAEVEHSRCGIRYNPDAGLWHTIINDRLNPVTNEFDYQDASGRYVAQRAEGPAGAFVYVWDGERVIRVPVL